LLTNAFATPGSLDILRLGSPYGELHGLALSTPNQERPWPCVLALAFAQRAGREDVEPRLNSIASTLQTLAGQPEYAELSCRPRPNHNLLFDVHHGLAQAPAYWLLATDLQQGLVAALARTGWRRTPAAAKSLDAMATSAQRILPRLDPVVLEAALAAGDVGAVAAEFRQVALSLDYERQPGRPLPERTQLGYLRDCCRLLLHPEWAEAAASRAPLGLGTGQTRARRSAPWENSDDDPPETDEAPDRFRRRHLEQVERAVRRELTPGAALDEAAVRLAPPVYGEELAVMREYAHPAAWQCAHTDDLTGLLRYVLRAPQRVTQVCLETLDTRRLALRTAMLSLFLTGRGADWLASVCVGPWPPATGFGRGSPPVYSPEHDAIAYWPEAIPSLPQHPERATDLFEPISPVWVLPLPGELIPWWRELARRRSPGQPALGVTVRDIHQALQAATRYLRAALPHRPALTEGRLRTAFRAMFEAEAGLDPLLAGVISGQWRLPLRVPLFYLTVSADRLAERYRAAAHQVAVGLARLGGLPAVPVVEPAPLPQLRFGSPYLPRREVLQACVRHLARAIERARSSAEPDDLHNARTLLALYGLSVLCGCRISEAGKRAAGDFDLDARWNGQPVPWMVLPESKGNRWTFSARIVPLPDCLLPLLQAVLPVGRQEPAFYFIQDGARVPAAAGEIRHRLAHCDVPFPRWHAGRHWVETQALEAGLDFDVRNAHLGHQSASRELFGPYQPAAADPGVLWQAFRRYGDQLAQDLGWPAAT
jgi:integrase